MSKSNGGGRKGEESAIAKWQQFAAARLSEDDTVEVRSNLNGFVSLLMEWADEDSENEQKDAR